MKRRVIIEAENLPDGLNQLLLALEPADAVALADTAARLSGFAEFLLRLLDPGPLPPPEPDAPVSPAAAAPAPPGKAEPPATSAAPGEAKPAKIRGTPSGAPRSMALRLLRLLASGPRTSGDMARELGTINQNTDGALNRSPWFEKEREGTSKHNPTVWRLSPAGREALKNLPPPGATSPSAASPGASADPSATAPATSSPSPTPGATGA